MDARDEHRLYTRAGLFDGLKSLHQTLSAPACCRYRAPIYGGKVPLAKPPIVTLFPKRSTDEDRSYGNQGFVSFWKPSLTPPTARRHDIQNPQSPSCAAAV